MPRLAQRAVGTLGHLAPKAVDLLSTTGFAAAGVVSVVAENLRTMADRDEALPDRAKQVAQNSIGAVLAGPKALSDRGRSLVGRDGSAGDGSRTSSGNGSRAHTAGDTSGSKSTAKTVAPDERRDRSKAEEARDREASDPSRVTAERGTGTPASRQQDQQAGATKDAADEQKAQAKEAAAKAKDNAKEAAEKTDEVAAKAQRNAEEAEKKAARAKKAQTPKAKKDRPKTQAKSDAKKADAEKSDAATTGDGQDRPRSVEEKRAAEKAAKKQAQAKKEKQAKRSGSNGKQDGQDKPEGLPADIDDQLVDDLQAMTVKQLRDRAAQDGVPGRSGMNKDELVVALATRETDDVPAKA